MTVLSQIVEKMTLVTLFYHDYWQIHLLFYRDAILYTKKINKYQMPSTY